jgi:dynein heavy chain
LHAASREKLYELHEEFRQIEANLNRQPDTMEDLKFILNVIDQIWSSSMDMEMKYMDIEERYRQVLISLMILSHILPIGPFKCIKFP